MKTTTFCTLSLLDCSCNDPIIICISPTLTVGGSPFIIGTLLSSVLMGALPDGRQIYKYYLEYDETQLLDPTHRFTNAEINGVLCKGCLTDYIDFAVPDNSVPSTRTVNGHALSGDVTITKADVGLGSVPDVDLTARTINGHALSADITITKSDVGLGSVPNVDCTNPSNIVQDTTHRFVTDAQITSWTTTVENKVISRTATVAFNATEGSMNWDGSLGTNTPTAHNQASEVVTRNQTLNKLLVSGQNLTGVHTAGVTIKLYKNGSATGSSVSISDGGAGLRVFNVQAISIAVVVGDVLTLTATGTGTSGSIIVGAAVTGA